MGRTPDHLITSCHGFSRANWVGKDGQLKCSVCQSIHPNDFIARLSDDFLGGWRWQDFNGRPPNEPKRRPVWCDFENNNKFNALHLEDVPVEWLSENRERIAVYTGVVFYWRREILCWKQIAGRIMQRGDKLSDEELQRLVKILANLEKT